MALPFEFRVVAEDDIWMRPMDAGPVASISMHRYAKMPWVGLFAEAAAIFRGKGGRPHRARRHSLTGADVDRLYPQGGRFRAVRRRVDPAGKFLNHALAGLFA